MTSHPHSPSHGAYDSADLTGPPVGWQRHVRAVLACPGIFAVLLPTVLVLVVQGAAAIWPALAPITLNPAPRIWAIVLVVAGLGMLLWTNLLFHGAAGTLHPDDGPRRMVTHGPYAFARNPMILGVIAFLAGAAGVLGSIPVAVYLVAFVSVKSWYLKTKEEPHLVRQFGEEYERYRRQVPFLWIPWRRSTG